MMRVSSTSTFHTDASTDASNPISTSQSNAFASDLTSLSSTTEGSVSNLDESTSELSACTASSDSQHSDQCSDDSESEDFGMSYRYV